MRNQFHNLGFRKTKFPVVHQSDWVVFVLVLKRTISIYFSAVDVDSMPHISTRRFIVHDANCASECSKDYAGVAPALGLSLRHLLVLKSARKLKSKKSNYEPSRKIIDCTHAFPFRSFLETSVCVNAYIVEITTFRYVARLDFSIGFNKEGLLFSLSANAVTMI